MLSSVGLEHLAHNQTVLGSSPRASIRHIVLMLFQHADGDRAFALKTKPCFHGNTAEMRWAGFASLDKPGNRDNVTYPDTGAWRLIYQPDGKPTRRGQSPPSRGQLLRARVTYDRNLETGSIK